MILSPLTQAFVKLHKASTADEISIAIDLFSAVEIILLRKKLVSYFESPGLTLREKMSILRKIGEVLSLPEAVFELLALLIRKGRLSELPRIIIDLKRYRAHRFDTVDGTVISAIPLSSEQITQIEKIFTKTFQSRVVLRQRVDPTLLGGMVLRTDDLLFDASLRTKIRKLRTTLAR